jgi:hypothetical protein
VNAPSTPSTSQKPVSKRIEVLFSRFAAFYGYVWRNQFKTPEFVQFAKREWEEGLKAFDDEILNIVIEETRNFYELPPTLPSLISHCRKVRNRKLQQESVPSEGRKTPGVSEASVALCFQFLK